MTAPAPATSRTSASGADPCSTATVKADTATRLPMSHRRINRRRATVSARAPPGSMVTSSAPTDTVPMAPARTAEPVSRSTSNGNASADICEPSDASRPLSHSSRKSRRLARDVGMMTPHVRRGTRYGRAPMLVARPHLTCVPAYRLVLHHAQRADAVAAATDHVTLDFGRLLALEVEHGARLVRPLVLGLLDLVSHGASSSLSRPGNLCGSPVSRCDPGVRDR